MSHTLRRLHDLLSDPRVRFKMDLGKLYTKVLAVEQKRKEPDG